jgi:hypothetical protein
VTPKPDGGRRTGKTVNLYIGALTEFLRWFAVRGDVPTALIDQLATPKHLGFNGAAFESGEAYTVTFQRGTSRPARTIM